MWGNKVQTAKYKIKKAKGHSINWQTHPHAREK